MKIEIFETKEAMYQSVADVYIQAFSQTQYPWFRTGTTPINPYKIKI